MRKLLLVMLLVVGTAGVAVGDSITFSATGSNPESGDLAASATFEVVDSQLFITLTNAGPTAEVPSDLLAGVNFDLANMNNLDPVSATLVDGAVIHDGSTVFTVGQDLGGEFAFRQDLNTVVPEIMRGAQYGVNANGADDYFGVDHVIGGPNLHGPAAPDGANFGLASAISPTANSHVTGVPVTVGSVEFVFDVTGSLSVDDISNVNFQYGTDPADPNLIVPEPSTMSLLGIGIAGFLAIGKIRRKRT